MRLIAKSLRPHGPTIARSRPSTRAPTPVARFCGELRTRTPHAVWAFVNRLARPTALQRTLRSEKLSWDDYLKWPTAPEVDVPVWALIHTVAHRTNSLSRTQVICEAVLSRLPSIPQPLIPSILTLCIHALAQHQAVGSLRPIVSRFLQLPQCTYLQYHLFLKALSRFTPSLEVTRAHTSVLNHILDSGFTVKFPTYAVLLGSPSRSATIARELQKIMILQGKMPSPEIFLSFFHVYVKRGATKLALTQLEKSSQGGHITSPPNRRPTFKRRLVRMSSHNSENVTGLLNSFGKPAAAFEYLELITKVRGPVLFESTNIRGWTSILSLTAKGEHITAPDLLNLFEKIKENFKPTAVTYTVLIRALASRRDFEHGISVWEELIASGIPLDVKSLSAGVEIYTLAGQPLEAFHLLERYARKPRGSPTNNGGRITITPPFINVFMENLLQINRPDAIFVLWDHAQTLYRVMPDTSTLNILLSTARTVGKYDETFTGFWAQFRANLYHDKTPFTVAPREEIVQRFEKMLTPAPKRKNLTGMWDDTPAWQKAARIFCHAVIGNSPHLLKVSAPASPLRSSADETGRHPFKELTRNILGPSSHDDTFFHSPEADLTSPATLTRLGLYPLGAYPKVFPTAITFHNYIYLLGLNNQASQIPLALAWMRELELLPLKRTIAISLVFWAEVSLRAPLLDELMGQGEYAKLVRWLEEWVGVEKMPGHSRMGKANKVIARAREGFDYVGRSR